MKLIYKDKVIGKIYQNSTSAADFICGYTEKTFHSLKSYDYITIYNACKWRASGYYYYVYDKEEHTIINPNEYSTSYLIFNKMRIFYNNIYNVSKYNNVDICKLTYDNDNNVATEQVVVKWLSHQYFITTSSNSSFTGIVIKNINKGDVLNTGLGITFTCTDKTSDYVDLVTNEPIGIHNVAYGAKTTIQTSKVALDTSIIKNI